MAKEGLQFSDEGDDAKERLEELSEEFKPLTTWLKEEALSEHIDKAVVSNRLTDSPCALVAGQYGWWVELSGDVMMMYCVLHCRSGNMERIMQAQAYAQGKETR